MLAVDWSGDAGLNNKGASRHFALAVVSIDDDEVGRILSELRKEQRYSEHFEYHFVQGPCRTDSVRHRFMKAFAQSGLHAAIVSVDKAGLIRSGFRQSGTDFVAYYLWDLLQSMPNEHTDQKVLLVDGQKADVRPVCTMLKSYLRQGRRDPNNMCRLKNMRPAESHRCEGIMVADMLAGAARYVLAGKTPDYLAPLRSKLLLKQIP